MRMFCLGFVDSSYLAYSDGNTCTVAINYKYSENIGYGKNVVKVSSSVAVDVSNSTLKIKDGMLRSAVSSFLNSGPNVLKTSVTNQPLVKTKIDNKINNVTQSVQGAEATNAIIGVEVSKALKTLVLSFGNSTGVVTVDTSSTCKPSASKSISCDNTVTIK